MIQRVVFDCMVVLQGAARSRGPAAACLALAEADKVELFVSKPILEEMRDVMSREKVRRRFPVLTPEFVASFLRRLTQFTTILDDVPMAFPLPRDVKDEKYLNLAIAVNAKYLVSHDKDLLDLMKPALTEGKAFLAKSPNLEILEPPAFLQKSDIK